MKTRPGVDAVSLLKPRLVSVAVAACFAAPAAFALPTGPQVVVGSAAFSQQTGALTVTNTPGTVINWRGFSIGASEAARFIQQGPTSSVLNRVIGAEASAILGALQSNGRVWLVNPNGILFGPSARIDVQGLVASTLAISNSNFLAGKMNFEAGAIAGGIQNQGNIKTREGGSVFLVAPDIQNSGIIRSPQGEVMLAAGHKVSLVEAGNPDVQMVVSAPADQAVNLGQILVEGGRASLFGATLVQRGIVSANSVGTDAAGNIVFRAGKDVTLAAGSKTVADGGSGGTITVQAKEGTNLVHGDVSVKGSEGMGGSIQLLGDHVGLVDSASVDASGKTGGGTVLIGGDFQGKNAAVQNASATYVGANTQVKADATDAGDGGKVIVWSNDATRVYGVISAMGGANSGDGGFVEASGKAFLDFDAKVTTAAPLGRAGMLLLDPISVTITDAVYGGGSDLGLPVFVASATTTISAGAIELNGATTDVSIAAGTDITLNNLTVGGLGHTDLTLTGLGKSITLTAGNDLSFVNPTTGITTNGGAITLTASAGSLNNIGKLTTNSATAGNINLTAGNQISLNNTLSAIGTTKGIVTLTAGAGGITDNAGTGLISGGGLRIISTGSVDITGDNSIDTLAANITGAGSSLNFRNNGSFVIGQVGVTSGVATNNGAITIYGDGGSLTVNENVSAGTGAIDLDTVDSGGPVTIYGGSITISGGSIELSSSGSDVIIGIGAQLNASGAAGDVITVTANGAFNNAGTLSATNAGAGMPGIQVTADTIYGGNISTVNGNVRLVADTMYLAGGAITPARDAFLIPKTLGRSINLGATGYGGLTLTSADLNSVQVDAPYTLYIGDSAAGTVNTRAALVSTAGGALQNISSLKIETGDVGSSGIHIDHPITMSTSAGLLQLVAYAGNVDQTAPITTNSLYAQGLSVYLDLPTNSVNNIAGQSFNVASFKFSNAGPINVSTVAGHIGIDSQNTDVTLTSYGGGITQDAPIRTSSLEVVAAGPVNLDAADNDVNFLAGSSVGGFRFHNGTNWPAQKVTIGVGTTGVTNSGGGLVWIDGAEGVKVAAPIYSGGSDIKLVAGGSYDLVIENTVSTGTLAGPDPVAGGGNIWLEATAGNLYVKSDFGAGTTGSVTGDQVVAKANNLYFWSDLGTPTISGYSNVRIMADSIDFMQSGVNPGLIEATNSTDGMVRIGPRTSGYGIGIGTMCPDDVPPCLLLSGFDLGGSGRINAPQLVIGNSGLSGPPGEPTSSDIFIDDTISRFGGVVAFDTLGTVKGTGNEMISADTLAIRAYGASNSTDTLQPLRTAVGTVVASLIGPGPADFRIYNYDGEGAPPLTIGSVTIDGTPYPGVFRAGPSAASVNIQNVDDIIVANPIDAGAGSVSLFAQFSAIYGGGLITGLTSIDLAANNGIGSIATPLQTRTAQLSAENYISGDIAIINNSAASGPLQLLKAKNWGVSGQVKIENTGAMTLVADGGEPGVVGYGGATLLASGPLSLDSGVSSGGGNIVLKGSGFTNNGVGPFALFAPSGRWLVYADNPGSVAKGGLIPTLYQYNTAYPGTVAPAGSGFIYASPLRIDAAFTGTLSSIFGSSPTATPGYLLRLLDLDSDDITTAAAVTGSATYSNWPITTSTAAGSYALQYVSGLSAPSLPYTLTLTPGTSQTYTVSPAPITIFNVSASLTGTASKTYDGTTNAILTPGNFLLSGFVSTDSAGVTKTTGTYASKNVGSGLLVSTTLAATDFIPVGSTNLSNYILPTSASGNIGSITPAGLTVSGLAAQNKVYDATTLATLTGTAALSGIFGTDVVTLGGGASASFNNKNVGTAKPVTVTGLTLAGADAGNYTLGNTTAATSADITPASLTVSGLAAQNKVYDGTTLATLTGTATFSGVLGTDIVTLGGATGSFNNKHVGSAKPVTVTGLTLTGVDAGNYTLGNTTAATSADITARALNVTATGVAKVYDGGTSATVTYGDNRVAGDVLTLGGSASYLDKNVGIAKPVNVSGIALSGADAGNYSFNTTASTNADITPASLTVSGLAAQNKVYDATTTATLTGTAAFSGVLGTDLVTLGGSASASFNNKHVGSAKPVAVTGLTLAGVDAGNYTLGNTTAVTSADITPASLTLSGLAAQNKVYDATTAATVSGTLSGVLGTDAVALGGGASFNDKNVGSAKPVTLTGLTLAGADAGNYVLSGSTATMTADITVRPLSTWIGGASGNWSSPANWDALPDLSNVTAVSVPAGTTVTYDAAAGSTNLATLTAAGLSVAGGSLSIGNNLTVNSSFSQTGGTLGFGSGASASITQASGNLNLLAFTLASLSLSAPAGAITQSGPIIATTLNTQSQTGTTLTDAGNKVASFTAANSGSGNVALTNTGALTIPDPGIINSGGNIVIDNTGAVTTVGAVSAPNGVLIGITAHSPLTIGAGGVSGGGNIVLTASDTPGSNDSLTLSGPVSSTGSGGSIALSSGDSLLQNANVSTNGGAVTAASQSGNISMALGTTTSTGGGGIGYTASSGNVALTSLNAGSGAINLNAGGDIGSVAGFTGANLIGGQALIAAGGDANLSTQVALLDVKVKGTYSITDVLTGGVTTNVPAPAPVLNQVTSTVVAATQSVTTTATTQLAKVDDKDKEKEDDAKKKQQTTQTTITGVKIDDKPKNFCN